ncbi:MAG TPA: 50S ribosomal protein L17 [Patescibacteria group bacterium]|nr:50S ribosomal protein L17 [Patescibacteria group bacterium]
MQHQQNRRKFGRKRNQRKALMKTMLGSLIMREKIQTTEAKAKELKNRIDRIINKAKKTQKSESRVAIIRDLKNSIPLMAVSKVITDDFIKRVFERKSGYARVIKLPRRKGDGAKMAILELVD